jgi:oligopeptide transport system substrate-binding protein
MADEPLSQRKRNALVAGGLFLITLIASLASILPFVGVTSIGQLGTAIVNIAAAYSRGLVRLAGYIGIIGFSLLVALWAVYLVRVLLLARRKTDRQWRLYEAALALPLVVALLVPFYVPAPVPLPPAPLSDEQQVWRAGLQQGVFDPTLDPAKATFVNTYFIADLIFPGLVKLDANNRVQNWAASRVQISPDGVTYTFTLHAGMKWTDGAPIEASDFAYSINRALDPCVKSPIAPYLFAIKGASAFNSESCDSGKTTGAIQTLIGQSLQTPDPHTLVIRLEKPTSYFLAQLTYPVSYAVPRALVEKYGPDWTSHLTDHGGFGGDLFKITSWDRAHSFVLQRNEQFWGAKAKLRELDYTLYPGDFQGASDAAYSAYLDGHAEYSVVSQAQYPSARLRPDFHVSPNLETHYFVLNWSMPPFDDLRLRQAFALSLDKARLIQDTCPQCLATNHIVPSGMPGYNDKLKGPDGAASLTGNVARAKALAQDYASDKCAGSLANCPPVTLTYLDVPGVASQMQEARSMWEEALPGYPIALRSLPPPDFFTQVTQKSLQMLRVAWAADYADPQDFLSNLFVPESPWNEGNANLPAATTLMRQADVELNPTKRFALYNQAEQLLVSNVAWIPLYQPQTAYVVRPYVAYFRAASEGFPSIETWQRMYLAKQ